ncbi:VPGUxxT family thioredoxin-like (seleno)protein, type 2 [Flavobacterium macacae]|uniref:Thioredoxin family protein n=1 Tax=Flavobacterium macacae TaxID=2488993 RepID=A0A3P3W7Z3_9FLAO|nr:VPGUxxT family thioredoxin-like (seleno)protein, type 2 [Flavobacterium macacae]RRJ90814.1 thioredoxin family protein [Flavobacterium macacae]
MQTRTDPRNQNIELGKVTWLRDHDEALRLSELTGKPVLLFFQEIPGCATCVNFGRDVLSYHQMVEFIENEFVPLAIFNNIPGKDKDVLAMYNERSWNNPVAHFVDFRGRDIIPKLANNYKPLSMYNKMVEVLDKLGTPIPKYAALLGEDLKMEYGELKSTIYETPCFWSGETSMALHPAVKYTEAGWIKHAEVVKVFFDDSQVSLGDLNSYATNEGFFLIDDHRGYRIDERPQYYLSKSPFKFLRLGKAQRSQINVAIPYGGEPEQYLSPRQKVQYEDILKASGHNGKSKNYKQDTFNSCYWN